MGYGKKRKRDETRYTCQICLSDRIESRFPDVNPTDKCTHLINTCTTCLQDWIKSQLASTMFTGGISCPECEEVMKAEDIQLVANKKTAKQFVDLDRRRVGNETPGWYWCLNVDCTSGQVHPLILRRLDSTAAARVAASDIQLKADNDDNTGKENGEKLHQPKNAVKARSKIDGLKEPETLFTCNACSSRFCVACNKAWHPDETCEEHAKRTTGQHAIAEMKSLKAVGKVSKKCPSCERPTIRQGGCKHMWCIICEASWCWTCVETFDKSGCACTRKALLRANNG